MDELLSVKGLTKRFPGVLALDDVEFELVPGEIHALVGHNGAGKSTLIKILSGLYRPDEGTIRVAGKSVQFHAPADAHAAGIATIHQEVILCPHLSVYENLILGREPLSRGRAIARRDAIRWARKHLEELGLELNPSVRVGDLPLAMRQLVTIAKALASNARVLILDEPTAVLPGADIERLFALLRRLRSEGTGIIYVSHRLGELHEIGDRVTVFRNGRRIETAFLADRELDHIVEGMVGGELQRVFPVLEPSREEISLTVENLVLKDGSERINLTVHKGEVVGITGLVASGKEMLAQVIAGAMPARSGKIMRAGRPLRLGSRLQAIKADIGYLSSDRRGEAIIVQRDVIDNTTLASLERYCSFNIIRRKRRLAAVKRWVASLGVSGPGLNAPLQLYSGGNQQKIALAKWLDAGSRILVMVEPTSGLDVGAKVDVYRLIRDLAADGVSILLISSDLEEVAGMAHRVLVLQDGAITAEFDGSVRETPELLHGAVIGMDRIS